jgi:phenylpropionate dioxygenase-like ring-hydroxylating dioxygenase large terminal subunit
LKTEDSPTDELTVPAPRTVVTSSQSAQRLAFDGDVLLSDGTPLSGLIDEHEREVSLRVHHDQEIFEIEMEKIFARSWLPVAHESEIPNAGDYVRRYMGQDSCLVVRDSNGAVNVLLNVCSHRGMSLCRAEQGNSSVFKCPYHGWAYDISGQFLGAPFEREMYGDYLRSRVERLALTKARTASIGGLVFANWNPDAEPFDEYLGDIKWYLDAVLSRTDRGLEAVGPPQRHIIKANWKLLAEQLPDGYHTMTLHQSLAQLGVFQHKLASGINVSTRNGHTLRCVDIKATWNLQGADEEATVEEKLAKLPPPGTDAEMTRQFSRNLTEGQMKLLTETPPMVMGLFPGADLFAFLSHDGTEAGGLGPVMMAHAWVPLAPDLFEMMSWILVEHDASSELRNLTRRTTVRSFGISGVIEQDDAEAWRGIQRSMRGVMGRKVTGKYGAMLGINKPEYFEGGGDVYAGTARDDAQWAWWTRYFEVMTS